LWLVLLPPIPGKLPDTPSWASWLTASLLLVLRLAVQPAIAYYRRLYTRTILSVASYSYRLPFVGPDTISASLILCPVPP